MKIIFVCTGNTCRSPIAESIAKQRLPKFDIQSRGIYAVDGQSISYPAEVIISENELPLPSSACSFSEADLDADLILTMSQSHKQQIENLYSQSLPIYTLYEYIGLQGDVRDPFGGSYDEYQEIYQELKYLISELESRLQKK